MKAIPGSATYPGQKKVYTSQKCFDKFGKFTNIDSSQILVWLRIFRTTLQESAKRAFCARQPLCRGEMDGWAMTAGLRHIQNSAVFPVLVGLFFILAVLRKKVHRFSPIEPRGVHSPVVSIGFGVLWRNGPQTGLCEMQLGDLGGPEVGGG